MAKTERVYGQGPLNGDIRETVLSSVSDVLDVLFTEARKQSRTPLWDTLELEVVREEIDDRTFAESSTVQSQMISASVLAVLGG